MTSQCFEMKEALRYGIHAEIEAGEFYRIWAESVSEPHLKAELMELSEWENEHEESLKSMFEKMYGETCAVDPAFVVSPELKVQTKDFGDVTSLLRIASAAYLSEMRAMEFYEKLSKESDGEAAIMFGKLMEMEKGHMDITKKQYLRIREDVAGFRAF